MATKKDVKIQTQTKAQILKTYLKGLKKHKRPPTEAELVEFGLTRNKIRWYFKNPKDLKAYALAQHPEAFENIIDESMFTDENMDSLEALVENTNVVMVSSAVTGCKPHKGFLKAMNSYLDKRQGVPLFIPITDPASKAGFVLAPELGREHIVFGDLALNSNLYINGIKMSAKQIDPTTGLNRMGHTRSFIFGSPKQRLRFSANSINKYPHATMGTGAVTLPNYETNRYMSERTAKLAQVDHKVGALIVELDPDGKYYFRQVQAASSGAFADLGKLYMPDGRVLDYAPEFFVMGDLHPGEVDEQALNAWEQVVRVTKAKNGIIHDGYNGHSSSHWLEGKIMDKARMAIAGMTSIEAEGKLCAKYLKKILSWFPAEGKLYMVGSNHNDFLSRYLNDKRWIKDYENLDFVTKHLIGPAMQGQDPVKVLVEMFLTPQERTRIVWWDEHTDFRFAGCQLAAHGHLGPNGSKGTLKNLAAAFGSCFVGHSHTSGIYQEAYQVGTTTHRKLPYTKGPSSWMHASGLLYANGSKQLIHVIDGKWHLEK